MSTPDRHRLSDEERRALGTILPESTWDYDPDRFKVEVEAVVEAILAARAQADPAPECRQCGPGYRLGDVGCSHTPAPVGWVPDEWGGFEDS